ncbi:tyrosine-type recombinase/integrase [Streptomyces olivaceus]|nr:tyrosine-type recombinase/integrase [Streptomyces olivaceus]
METPQGQVKAHQTALPRPGLWPSRFAADNRWHDEAPGGRRFSRTPALLFHDLRHSTATLLIEQGVDLVVIKELLGYAHIGVSAGVYAHDRRLGRPTHRSRRLTLPSNALETRSESPPSGPPDFCVSRVLCMLHSADPSLTYVNGDRLE